MSEYCKNCFELQNKIDELKAENDRLKRENEIIAGMHNSSSNRFNKLYSILQEIKEYLEDIDYIAQFDGTPYDLSVEIKQIITKAEEE